MPYAAVGFITTHKLLEDGRYHILVTPVARVHLEEEIYSDGPYRIFRSEVLGEAVVEPERMEEAGERVRGLLLMVLGRAGGRNAALARSVSKAPATRLAEMIAPLVITGKEERQRYLAEDDPLKRARTVETAAAGLYAENVTAAEA